MRNKGQITLEEINSNTECISEININIYITTEWIIAP